MTIGIVHWEILAKDPKRLQAFYAELFAWKIDADNPMNYGIVSTGVGIGGGIGPTPPNLAPGALFYIQVDDLQPYLDRASKLGGKTLLPPTEIPNVVTFAQFQDPEGNRIGLVQGSGQPPEAKNITQEVTFDAPPHEVFEALMDQNKHAAFTGGPATISREIGGRVSCYGDWVEAMNVELVRDERIVQSWRGKDWATGAYSIATFNLEPIEGGKKTRLSFIQTGVPAQEYAHITKGWHEQYWAPLQRYLKKG